MLVETLIAKLAVEALHKAVFDGLARADEVKSNAVLVGP